MISLESQLKGYLAETIRVEPDLGPYPDAKTWPLAFRSAYTTCEGELLGRRILWVFPRNTEISPATLAKQLAWMRKRTGLDCIVVLEGMTAYTRGRLMKLGLPFVVPGNQMYLPDFGLDLREHLRQARPAVDTLSPSAQLLVLTQCLHPADHDILPTVNELAGRFGYSKMTMSRALNELAALHLVARMRQGRRSETRFLSKGKALWEKARPMLQSPVARTLYVKGETGPIGCLAGESALAAGSMLADPPLQVRAVAGTKIHQADLHTLPEEDPAAADIELQLWSYDPCLLAQNGQVDPLSLILSFTDTTDERMEAALEEIEEAVTWS